MSKPFDALELRARIANILSIRRILKSNASHHIQVSQLKPIPSITLQDQNFLNKLNRVLDKNHSSPSFSVAKMASEMAVSERQLQRKLKSIVDLTPLDYLRNHRLEKSVIFLREGKKITTLSYDCGFVAPSHFARCFKAKYGITPKQYQKGKIQGAYISETPN
jgi:AraC-like DNA-binding protein